MRKYFVLWGLSIQKQLEVRTDFIFERSRSICLLLSMYYLWASLLSHQNNVAGYTREQMLTYVLLITVLRAFVLSSVTDRLPSEIAKGKLSDLLLQPLSPMGYWIVQDLASKVLNVLSMAAELCFFYLIIRPPFYCPGSFYQITAFALSVVGGMIIYFQMSYLLGVMGFWTAQSWGPRFCFEILLEFSAGAYFPVDLLPRFLQKVVGLLPFPSLLFHPVSIYLGRAPLESIPYLLLGQGVWIVLLAFMNRHVWALGLRAYGAEGR